MTLLMFSLIVLWLGLEGQKRQWPRVLAGMAVLGVAAVETVDMQTELRMCHMDEALTVEFLRTTEEDSCPVAVRAAREYTRALENATYESPFQFGFHSYLVTARRIEAGLEIPPNQL